VSIAEIQEKYFNDEISTEEYIALLSAEQESKTGSPVIEPEEDPGFFDVFNQSIQQLLATGGAGIRVMGEVFNNEGLRQYGDQVVKNREAQAAKYGRPMQIEDIEGVGDAADWLFTSAIPQVIPSILATVPLAVAGGALGAAAVPAAAAVTAGRIGAAAGAFLPSSFLGAGEIDRELKSRAGEGFEDPLAAIGGGAIIGALDTAALAVGLTGIIPQLTRKTPLGKKLLDDTVAELVNKGVTPSIAKRAFAQGALAAIAEGSTEASQELVNDLIAESSTGVSTEESELTSNLINAFALGAVGGTAIGTVSGGIRARTLKDNVLVAQERKNLEDETLEEARNKINSQQLEDLTLTELSAYADSTYKDTTFNKTNKDKLIQDIINKEQSLLLEKKISEARDINFLEGEDLNGKEEIEIKTIEEQFKSLKLTPLQVTNQAREIDPTFTGSLREAIELVAKDNIDKAHLQSGKSKNLFNGLALERYRAMLASYDLDSLARKAVKASPHLYKDIETAKKASRQELAKEIAFAELSIAEARKNMNYEEKNALIDVEIKADQDKDEIEQNVINLKDPKNSSVNGFTLRYKDKDGALQTQEFVKKEKVGTLEGKVVTLEYQTKDGKDYDTFLKQKEGVTEPVIQSYSVIRGKQAIHKEKFLDKVASVLSGLLSPGGQLNIKRGVLGNVGQAAYLAERKNIGRQRAINKEAEMLAFAYDEAANLAVVEGKVENREQLDELVFSYLKKEIPLSDLPESIRSTATTMRATIDGLSKRALNELPDSALEVKNPRTKQTKRETLEAQLGAYATRSYKIFDPTFGWNPSGFFATKEQKKVFDNAVKFVQENNDLFPEITNEDSAKQKVNDIVKKAIKENQVSAELFTKLNNQTLSEEDLKTSPLAKFQKDRANIPREFRELFGEFKNPSEILVSTVNKITQFVENNRYYNELLKIDSLPGERLFTTAPTAKYDTLVPLKDTPIDNLYTTKPIAEALKLVQDDKSTMETIYENIVLIPKGVFQSFKTIFSPMAQMRNYMTASMFYVANGNLNVRDFPQTMKAIGAELSGKGYDSKGNPISRRREAEQLYQQMLELGVVNTNVSLGEILATFEEAGSGGYRNLNEFIAFLGAQGGGKVGKFFSFTKKIGRQPAKLYTAADDFWKIASFVSEKRAVENAFDNSELGNEGLIKFAESLDIKTGTLDYDKIINEVAAYKVRNTIPNYDYVGSFVRLLRKTPFAPFVAFPTEILRTGYNMYWLAGKEISSDNFQMKVKGYRRLIGAGTMMFGLPTIAVAAGKALSEVDDEELDAIRRLGPEWIKNSFLIPLGKKETARGPEYEYMDGSHMFVYDTIASTPLAVFRAIKEGKDIGQGTPESVANGIAEGVYNIVKPYISLSIAPEIQIELLTNRVLDTGRPITSSEKPWGEQASDLFTHAFQKGQPGFVQQIGNLLDTGNFDEYSFSKYGSKKDFEGAVLSLLGVKINSANAATSVPFKISEAKKRLSSASGAFTRLAYSSGPISANDLLNAYKNVQEAYFDIQREGYLDIEAARLLGVSPRIINKQIDRISPKSIRRAFKTGVFVPYAPPKTARSAFNQETRKMTRQGATVSADRYYPTLELNKIKSFYLSNRLNLLLDFYLPKDED
jgi:hypothetical protein